MILFLLLPVIYLFWLYLGVLIACTIFQYTIIIIGIIWQSIFGYSMEEEESEDKENEKV